MVKILICGLGIVGNNIFYCLSSHNKNNWCELFIYDKYLNIGKLNNESKNNKYDFCFICVNTPLKENNYNDISEVENVLSEINADIYILKSTVLPETTKRLIDKYNKKIVFSPEYYGDTQHCNDFTFNFTILGGNKEDCLKVQQMLQNVYNATHKFAITDSTTAELVKYMENSFLATKVSFCTSFWETCNKLNINYEEVRELFVLDPRVNSSHTFVYNNKPYWNTHCLNKDVVAIAKHFDNEFLKGVITFNNNNIKKY